MKLFPLLLIASVAAQNSLVDTFASVLTGGDEERATRLVDTLTDCGSSVSTNLYSDILSNSLNATRTCFSTETDREHALKCIDKSTHVLELSTSPYDIFSVHELTTSDIDILKMCSEGLGETTGDRAHIINAYTVIVKRFLQCEVTLNEEEKDDIYDIFGGADRAEELARAQLSATCTSLTFAGQTHSDTVAFIKQTLKHALALIPKRR